MKPHQLIQNSKRKLVGAFAVSLLIGISQTHATQTVRELFDKIGNSDYITIDGLGSGATSEGLQGTWTTSPSNSTGIVYKDTWSLDWPLGDLEYGGVLLGHNGGQNGLLNFNSGGNLNTLIDPDTGLPYGNWSSKSYATRPLAPSAYIDFQANGTCYFSVRIEKSYPWSVGDSSAGLGFSTGGETNDHFVGIGVTRPSPFYAEDGITDIGNTDYVTTGTLGQDGFPFNPYDSGGPYYARAYGPADLWTVADGTHAGLIVGRLTTTTSGNSTLDVKSYVRNGAPLDSDPGLISWDATYNFTETNLMTHLLVWMHGPNVEYDAIRVGTTYGDVIGLELIGAPMGSPANTVYAGTTVTLSQLAGLDTGAVPMSFQWRSNGVEIVDATNATLLLPNPTTDFTANYSVMVSNYYGTLTSPETLITINPAVPPFYVLQPQPAALTRYSGAASAAFSVVVDGTPPFTYQWQYAGTNLGSATITVEATNTLTIGPITAASAGDYSVTVANAFGSTNSAAATLMVIEPAPTSYAAALLAVSTNLYAYWRLDDNATTNDPTINDYWGGHNGQVNVSDLSMGRITFGVERAPFPASAAPQLATAIGTDPTGTNGAVPYRLNLSKLPVCDTNMTFTMWVKGGCRLMTRNGYGQGYGLENQGDNTLRFYWGAYDATNGVKTAQWDPGLVVPENEWSFVALVVENTNAIIYVGTQTSFTSVSSVDFGGFPDYENGGYMTLADSTTLGESATLSPLAVGRNPWPWADDGAGAPWASTGGTWSDVAVIYEALTPQKVESLYLTGLAGFGFGIESSLDGEGNLVLDWTQGPVLQQADNVEGPYIDIDEAAPPYTVPILSTGNKFYRLEK